MASCVCGCLLAVMFLVVKWVIDSRKDDDVDDDLGYLSYLDDEFDESEV